MGLVERGVRQGSLLIGVEADEDLADIGVPRLARVGPGVVAIHHGRRVPHNAADVKRLCVVHHGEPAAHHVGRLRHHIRRDLCRQVPVGQVGVHRHGPGNGRHVELLVDAASRVEGGGTGQEHGHSNGPSRHGKTAPSEQEHSPGTDGVTRHCLRRLLGKCSAWASVAPSSLTHPLELWYTMRRY